ncbi:hypothetical protein E2C01_079227 [Portunus trituberculatus]|uniref:Uncharacterized protein n=1 Tax=Portunus trituberculatus TaxID=210409 RepID=A0A5B7IV05_PORTR|nr:hypothetical protein [Portunus trituberculatus]
MCFSGLHYLFFSHQIVPYWSSLTLSYFYYVTFLGIEL